MTESQRLVSPRLADLLHALADGDEVALDRFWHEIEAVGTPLIEPIPGDDAGRVITFLYRATHAANCVEIDCSLEGRGRTREAMTRLPLSDIWYRSYRVRPGLRTEYLLAVDGIS